MKLLIWEAQWKVFTQIRSLNCSHVQDKRSAEEEAGRKRSRRKRQLIFFDPVTQVSQEDIQRQISDPQCQTRSLPLPPSTPRRRRSAAELLNNPCTRQSLEFLCDLKEHNH